MLCDRIAKAIDRRLATDFPGLGTMDTLDREASERRTTLHLSVFDSTRERREHIADYSIAVERVGVERYTVDLYARALVDGDPRAEDLVTRFARPDLSVEETIRYYAAGDAQGVAVRRRVEVYMGPVQEAQGLGELEGEAFLARTAKKASEWLGVLREILRSVAENPGVASTAG
jgi:hypothetical protein